MMRAFDGLDLVLALTCVMLALAVLTRDRGKRGARLDAERVIHEHWND